MSRRIAILACLSLAAIILTSFALLQGRSEFVRPLFPKPWGTGSSAKGGTVSPPASIPGTSLGHGESASTQPDEPAPPPPPPATGLDGPTHDVHSKPDSPALSDESAPGGTGKGSVDKTPPSPADMAQTSTGGNETAGGSTTATPPAEGGLELNVTIAETGGFHDEVIDIDIVEVGGSHDEVIAALIHSFGSQPEVKLELYQRVQRYGIEEIFKQFELSRPLPKFRQKTTFNGTEHQPHILVSTTCELDSVEHRTEWDKLLEQEKTYLFCVVHHADRWHTKTGCHDVVRPWARKGLVDFVMLSRHTQLFMDEELKKWDLQGAMPSTRHFIPIFPVQLPEAGAKEQKDELGFALQGDFDPNRRDYGKIFRHLKKFLAKKYGGILSILKNKKSRDQIKLHLLGHGKKPEVPEDLVSHVTFNEDLHYADFYGILSRTFALLPAFASKEYLDRKASSTVPASLIAGTPLVATQAILDAYSYLPREAVWLQKEGEEDFDVIGRVLQLKPEERRAKKEKVRAAASARVQLNQLLAGEWTREAIAKVHKLQDATAEEAAKAKAEAVVAETKTDAEAPEGQSDTAVAEGEEKKSDAAPEGQSDGPIEAGADPEGEF